jgi:hypothetical protein
MFLLVLFSLSVDGKHQIEKICNKEISDNTNSHRNGNAKGASIRSAMFLLVLFCLSVDVFIGVVLSVC